MLEDHWHDVDVAIVILGCLMIRHMKLLVFECSKFYLHACQLFEHMLDRKSVV